MGLTCRPDGYNVSYWVGEAHIGCGATQAAISRTGPVRRSIISARRDAERLAVELLFDIRDGVNDLLKRHGINTGE